MIPVIAEPPYSTKIKSGFKKENYEVIHYYDGNLLIASRHNKIFVKDGTRSEMLRLPEPTLKMALGKFRVFRRLLRLDKCNVYPVSEGLVLIRQGAAYIYNYASRKLTKTLNLRNCRNILHQSIARTPEGYLYFGEYGANPERKAVPVYRSVDEGKSWEVIYEFEPGQVKHVHACCYDPIEDKVWVCTGDFEKENLILVADRDFKELEVIGNRTQMFRTCNFFFTEQEVHWLMDSQLETCYHVKLDRKSRQVEKLQALPGPVWYFKQTSAGFFAGTTQETGPGVKDQYAHLLYSEKLKDWRTVMTFEHDGLPKRLFKNGVIGFSEGSSDKSGFYLFFEALKGVDGHSILVNAEELIQSV
jgi:hypothetical protein